MSRIRPFRPGDEAGLAEVCLKTADAGADATGVLADDALWAEIFVLPYVVRHPEFAFVVSTDVGRIAGYVVGAPDTAAFEDWFAGQWWPRFGSRWPRPADPDPAVESTRQDSVLRYAYSRRGGAEPYGDEYPAHLHIDLLPELQGQGFGRRLIETLERAFREAGVTGLHLVAAAENAGAVAFYPRVGFTRLPAPDDVAVFAKHL